MRLKFNHKMIREYLELMAKARKFYYFDFSRYKAIKFFKWSRIRWSVFLSKWSYALLTNRSLRKLILSSTRMHSSGMRTARLLTAWRGCTCQGVYLLGVYLSEGLGCTCRGGVLCDLCHHACDVTCMLPPHQLRPSNSAAAYILLVGHVTCKACWDTPPLSTDRHLWKHNLRKLRLWAVTSLVTSLSCLRH